MKQKYGKFGKRRRLSPTISFLFHLKRNKLWLRRFAVLWLFLIALEASCPILDYENDLLDLTSVASQTKSLKADFFKLNDLNPLPAVKDSDSENNINSLENAPPAHCTDECLCHAGGVINLSFALPKSFIKADLSDARPKDAPVIAVSPPFHPPKQV